MTKWLTCMLTAAALSLSLGVVGCGGTSAQTDNAEPANEASVTEDEAGEEAVPEEESQEEEPQDSVSELERHKFGEMVSTDLAEVTLNDASFAIALVDPGMNRFQSDSNSLLPKGYSSDEDANNRYVASKGHSFVSMQFVIKNLDRNALTLAEYSGMPFEFANVEYKGQRYGMSKFSEYPSVESAQWYPVDKALDAIYTLEIGTDEPVEARGFIELPIEPDDWSDTPDIIVTLPNSDGTTTSFVYSAQ